MTAKTKKPDGVIYRNSPDNRYRYALGTQGENPLFCFGINPSMGTPQQYDPTLRRVLGVVLERGFDSFIMFNIYPLRAINPNDLPYAVNINEHNKNIRIIQNLLKSGSTIWAAWGDFIDSRPWLRDCRDEIFDVIRKNKKNISWVKMGDLTQKQNPRHPLYTEYQDFSEFYPQNP